MTVCDSYNIYPNLRANISNDQQFRLNKIIEIKDSFMAKIKERELTTDGICIASFANVTGATVGMMNASGSLAFSIRTGFVKKFLKTIRNKKKTYNKIVMLARSKLNGTES